MRRALLVLVAAALAALPLLAQERRHEEVVSVGYVMVPFTAYSVKGAPVTDLSKGDVTLQVDGRAVKTDLFERSLNAPVSYTILVDSSGSMALAGKLEAARAAVAALLNGHLPGDEYALWLFSDAEASEIVPFTEDGARVLRALSTIKPYGKTAFFDALATMPEQSHLGKNPSRAIILLSDGIDNASRIRREELPALLEGVAVPIYPLGLRDPREAMLARNKEELSDFDLLDQVANLTGGRLFLGNRADQLQNAIKLMSQSLRAQYLIGFSPTGKGGVKYRRISLKLGKRAHTVRVRAGYRGTEPPALVATARGQS